MQNQVPLSRVFVGKDKGVSPWKTRRICLQAPEGRQVPILQFLSPLRGFGVSFPSIQGLTPLATTCRPYGTGEPVDGSLPE